MYVLVRRSQRNTLHIHTNWNNLSFIRTTIHHLVLYKSFCFSFSGSSCSKSLFSHKSYLHTFDFNFNQVKVDSTDNDVFEMIKGLVILEVYMKTVLYSHFHLHGDYFSSCLYFFIRK